MTKYTFKQILDNELNVKKHPNPVINFAKILFHCYVNPPSNAVFLIRRLLSAKTRLGCIWYGNRLRHKYGIGIAQGIKIGLGLCLVHPTSIELGRHAVIGNNCRIYQGVTIGGRDLSLSNSPNQPQPIIGDDCILCAGAKILGGIKLGNGTIVGANAVLICDTEENSIYAGVPARRIK